MIVRNWKGWKGRKLFIAGMDHREMGVAVSFERLEEQRDLKDKKTVTFKRQKLQL